MYLALKICAVALCLFVCSGLALADAIAPPPKDCPPGSQGTSGHCGPACVPTACKTDADCGKQKKCRSTRLCIKKGERTSCGKVPPDLRHIKYPYTEVQGACPKGGKKCAAGTSCEEALRCAPPAAPAEPRQTTPPPKAEPPKAPPAKEDPPGAAPAKAAPASSGQKSGTRSSSCAMASPVSGTGALMIAMLWLLWGRRWSRS